MRRIASTKAALAAAALGATALPAQQASEAVRRAPELPQANCTPATLTAEIKTVPAAPLLVEGLGYAGVEPDSDHPEARAWFAQGVRLIWAFDEAEAIRAFKEAQRLDPGCALCFWGEAWARGPTINLRPRTAEIEAARAAATRAAELAERLSERDRLLVRAMSLRTKGPAFDNENYAKILESAALRMPGDDLVATLAADARMVAQTPDKFRPDSLTQRLLERVLARNPGHGGAVHYYIHLTDWIDRQHLAVPYAERLGRIAPAASHLVHMPSHTFYGVGRYRDAAAVNVAAIAADRAYVERVKPPESAYRTGLLAHNMHFAINSALARGDGATALQVSDQYRARYLAGEKVSTGFRLIGSAVYYTHGLHGDALALPEEGQPLGRALRHYARGEALARRGDAAGVRSEAMAMAAILDGPDAAALGSPVAQALVEVARHVLDGRAAMLAGNPEAAAEAYWKGMQRQLSSRFSSDPPLFWYSVRRSYAAALIAAGDHGRAREHLLASIRRWPNDPLALYALSQAEQALGDAASADRNLKRAKAVWAGGLEAVPLTRI